MVDGFSKNLSVLAKTSFIVSLADGLKKKGHSVHVWTKGTNELQTRFVNQAKKSDGLTEEAFILSQYLPTWFGNDPMNAIKEAQNIGATTLIIVNLSKVENYDFVPIFRILLFEQTNQDIDISKNPGKILQNDCVVYISKGVELERDNIEQIQNDVEYYNKKLHLAYWNIGSASDKTRKILAFSLLSEPNSFYQSLFEADFNVEKFIPPPKLGRYTVKQISGFIQQAKENKLDIVTSDKDFCFLDKNLKKRVKVIKIGIKLSKEIFSDISNVIRKNKIVNDSYKKAS